MHDELMRLAVGKGEGPPVRIHLGGKVIQCSPEDGTITLKGGEIVHADLVVGADGLHVGPYSIRLFILKAPTFSLVYDTNQCVGPRSDGASFGAFLLPQPY